MVSKLLYLQNKQQLNNYSGVHCDQNLKLGAEWGKAGEKKESPIMIETF
jgi:hypothetical protein